MLNLLREGQSTFTGLGRLGTVSFISVVGSDDGGHFYGRIGVMERLGRGLQ